MKLVSEEGVRNGEEGITNFSIQITKVYATTFIKFLHKNVFSFTDNYYYDIYWNMNCLKIIISAQINI